MGHKVVEGYMACSISTHPYMAHRYNHDWGSVDLVDNDPRETSMRMGGLNQEEEDRKRRRALSF